MNTPHIPATRQIGILLALTIVALICGLGCDKRSERATSADSMQSPEPSGSSSRSRNLRELAPPPAPSGRLTNSWNANTPNILSSSAARGFPDSTKKFVRTADLEFKVKHAIEATYALEDITARHHGFVTYTKLESSIDNKTVVPMSEDSSLTTTYYTVRNTMTLRVPDSELDSTLKEIAPLIDFLNHRTIRAEDVSLRLLGNQYSAERLSTHAKRLEGDIDTRGKKLPDVTDAEDQLLDRKEQADDARISNLVLLDQIKYSTIEISLYERQDLRRELIPNDKSVEAYKPGLGSQLLAAVRFGWGILEDIILSLVKVWSLILFFTILVLLYRRFFRTPAVRKSASSKE